MIDELTQANGEIIWILKSDNVTNAKWRHDQRQSGQMWQMSNGDTTGSMYVGQTMETPTWTVRSRSDG
jgi:hypothetical protein